MSSDYIFEYAKNFEDLYSKTSERIEMLRSHATRSDDLNSLRPLLSQMENTLNTLELEASLLNKDKSSGSTEYNILQSCRTHYNEVRKKFLRLEGEITSLNDRKNRTERAAPPAAAAVSDIESLHSRYGGNIPFDDIPLPKDLRPIKTREVFQKRLVVAASVLLALLLLIKLLK